jgi:hypothetical protein
VIVTTWPPRPRIPLSSTIPSVTLRMGVLRGAMMSMPLWLRPPNRAAPQVSRSCERITPSTGIGTALGIGCWSRVTARLL